MAKKKDKRFVKIYSDGVFGSVELFVDRETGVTYLFKASGYAGGLTPLLDREGKPIITEIRDEDML